MREGWKIKKLKEVCKIGDGNYSAKYPKASEFTISGVPFITATNLKNGTIVSKGIRYISEEQHATLTKGHIKEGDLVIVVRGSSTGNSSIVPMEYQNSNLNSQLAFLRTDNDLINSEYLYYVFNSPDIQRVVNETISGSAQPQLPNNKLLGIQIPIPPLSEQKQIVAILDKAFAAIDQAKANIEQNIVNAKELFQSKLNAIFSQKGEGWEEKSLGEVCFVLNGYAFKSKDAIEESNTQLLRMGNLYKNILDLTRKPVFYPDSFSQKHKDFLLKEGDLIMSLTGTVDKTDYGYTVKIPKIEVDLLLNQRIMKIEVYDKNILNKDYLKNYLLSPDFLTRLYDTASGTRQANLSSRTILTLKINYPTQIDKQIEVVKQFKQLRKNIFKLEQKYVKKIGKLEDLKKSILQKAFAGELTSTSSATTEKEVVV